MTLRVFIAIRPSKELASLLTGSQKMLHYLPVRWIPKDDLHLTLVPPWNEEYIDRAIETLQKVARGGRPCALRFKRIEYGPNEKRPSLIWTTGIASPQAITLRNNLLESFGVEEKRLFTPHITIARLRACLSNTGSQATRGQARFRKREWLDFKDRILNIPFEWEEEVSSLSLYESPHKGGIGYSVLYTASLQ